MSKYVYKGSIVKQRGEKFITHAGIVCVPITGPTAFRSVPESELTPYRDANATMGDVLILLACLAIIIWMMLT